MIREYNSSRSKFIRIFFDFMSDKNYSLLKYISNSIEDIDEFSDLDLAIKIEDKKSIFDFINNYEYIFKTKIYQNSFMCIIHIFFNDGSFLEIDLIHCFKRKELIYLDVNKLIEKSKLNDENIKIPNHKFQFVYIFLFYYLNGVDIEVKYVSFFKKLPKEIKDDILIYLRQNFGLNTNNFKNLLSFNYEYYVIIRKKLKKDNKYSSQLINLFDYFKDTLKNIKKSYCISFVSSNFSSKKSIISKFRLVLEKKYRKNVIILTHNKKNELNEKNNFETKKRVAFSFLFSLLKIWIPYISFFLIKLFTYFVFRFRGYIILFDFSISEPITFNKIPDKSIIYKFFKSLNKYLFHVDLIFLISQNIGELNYKFKGPSNENNFNFGDQFIFITNSQTELIVEKLIKGYIRKI